MARQPSFGARMMSGYHPFKSPDGGTYGSFEVFWAQAREFPAEDEGQFLAEGWYWRAGFPGCMPDGEPSGPFESSLDAYEDGRGT